MKVGRRSSVSTRKNFYEANEALNEKDNDNEDEVLDFVNNSEDDDLDSIKAFLESLENSENTENDDIKNDDEELNDQEIDFNQLIMDNLVQRLTRRGNEILVVGISKSEYEMLRRKCLFPYNIIDEFDLKKLNNRLGDSKIDLNKKNDQLKNFFIIDEITKLDFRLFFRKIASISCAPSQFVSAVNSNFSNEYNYNDKIFKYEVLDTYIKNNTFDTKKQYIDKLLNEISIVSSFKFVKKEFLKQFKEAYDLLNSYTLEEIKYYARMLK